MYSNEQPDSKPFRAAAREVRYASDEETYDVGQGSQLVHVYGAAYFRSSSGVASRDMETTTTSPISETVIVGRSRSINHITRTSPTHRKQGKFNL
jgi:hypothetical protein